MAQKTTEDDRIELHIEVEDTGIGIAPEALPLLFEPFAQAESSTARRYGGTGLGLAISRQIAGLMDGRIGVHSTPGQGSVFSAMLRLSPCADSGAERATPLPGASSQGSRRRILVAEDNAVNQILIEAMLARIGHFSDIVADGVEVVRQVQAARYDLVLMDVQMPLMDGIAATRAIRALSGVAATIPIIAMTANAMPEDRAACLAAGMNDYVAKPIDLPTLADAIERACAQPDVPPPAPAHASPFS